MLFCFKVKLLNVYARTGAQVTHLPEKKLKINLRSLFSSTLSHIKKCSPELSLKIGLPLIDRGYTMMESGHEPAYMSAKDLEAIRQGNEFVLRKIYKDHFSLIRKLVISNNGDEDDARDVYQEAFIVFYENVRREDFQLTCGIGTYLYSVSRNLWLKKLRAYSAGPERIEDEENISYLEDESEMQLQHEMEARVNQMEVALNALGEPCKTILSDYYYRKLSMQDIAAKMGYTNAENAKNQKYKCFNRLKKRLLENLT